MVKPNRLIGKILSGTSDANIVFSDMRALLIDLGFLERIKGDHHIFIRDDVEEIINIQPHGKMAKPYQVKQVRGLLIRYRLGDADV